SAPQIPLLAVDSHEDFVQMPDIAEATLPPLQFPNIGRTKLPTPMSNAFTGDDDAAFREKIFHISETHAEAIIDPHGVTNNFRWKTVSVVGGSGVHHGRSLSVSCPS